MNLLLLADEQENIIDKYLERGIMFAIYELNDKIRYTQYGYKWVI